MYLLSDNTYICKYIGNMDIINYTVVITDVHKYGKLYTLSSFLHNTNAVSSNHHEKKAIEKNM